MGKRKEPGAVVAQRLLADRDCACSSSLSRSAGRAEWGPVPGKALERRKPLLLFSFEGLLLFRLDEVQLEALLFQPPPRFTRFDPEEEPSSVTKSSRMPLRPNQRKEPSDEAQHWAKLSSPMVPVRH